MECCYIMMILLVSQKQPFLEIILEKCLLFNIATIIYG